MRRNVTEPGGIADGDAPPAMAVTPVHLGATARATAEREGGWLLSPPQECEHVWRHVGRHARCGGRVVACAREECHQHECLECGHRWRSRIPPVFPPIMAAAAPPAAAAKCVECDVPSPPPSPPESDDEDMPGLVGDSSDEDDYEMPWRVGDSGDDYASPHQGPCLRSPTFRGPAQR